jgi:hypothetical protein
MICRLYATGKVGSCELIRSAATEAGAVLQEFELDGQFRCAGSEEFIRWVDATLGITKEERLWKPDGQFDFRIFDGVQDMAEAIRAKATNGCSARLVAGFCWPWSNPDSSGQLVDDVKLDGFSMPWNAKPDAGRLAAGVPKSNFWASDPNCNAESSFLPLSRFLLPLFIRASLSPSPAVLLRESDYCDYRAGIATGTPPAEKRQPLQTRVAAIPEGSASPRLPHLAFLSQRSFRLQNKACDLGEVKQQASADSETRRVSPVRPWRCGQDVRAISGLR